MLRVNLKSVEFVEDEFIFDGVLQFIVSDDARGLILPSQFNEVFDNHDEVVNYFNKLGETIICSIHIGGKAIFFLTVKQWRSHGENIIDIVLYKAKLE
jgi:hypothetical protein